MLYPSSTTRFSAHISTSTYMYNTYDTGTTASKGECEGRSAMIEGIKMDDGITRVLLSPKEVASYLGTGYRRVLDLIATGELKAYRMGRVYRVSNVDLNNYVKSIRLN